LLGAACAREDVVIVRAFNRGGPPSVAHRLHEAVDIAAEIGDEVIACADGVVTAVHFQPGAGYKVYVAHPRLGIGTSYLNLRTALVKPGDRVGRGSTLGEVGVPPEPSDPIHVHWGMFRGRNWWIDPLATGVVCITNAKAGDRARVVYPIRC
jgi:murein DD-endopeptidase MepM/ murein hydrolase activator NlpD